MAANERTLMLGDHDRKEMAGYARLVRLQAGQLERHVQQNLTNVDLDIYLRNMRDMLNTIEERGRQ